MPRNSCRGRLLEARRVQWLGTPPGRGAAADRRYRGNRDAPDDLRAGHTRAGGNELPEDPRPVDEAGRVLLSVGATPRIWETITLCRRRRERADSQAPGRRKGAAMSLDRDARRAALLLISPALLGLLALNVFPMLYAVDISLYYWRLAGLRARGFISLRNYELLFGDDRFVNSILVSLGFVAGAVTVQLALGLALAFVFNSRLPGLATLRKLSLLPIMLMPLVVGLVWFYM